MSDSYKNYGLIRIYFSDNGVNNTAESMTEQNRAGFSNFDNANHTTTFYIHSCLLSFSERTATFERNCVTALMSNGVVNDNNSSSGLYVRKIVGYKY